MNLRVSSSKLFNYFKNIFFQKKVLDDIKLWAIYIVYVYHVIINVNWNNDLNDDYDKFWTNFIKDSADHV